MVDTLSGILANRRQQFGIIAVQIEAGDYGRAERLLDRAEARELTGIQAAQAAVERRRLSAAVVRPSRPSSC